MSRDKDAVCENCIHMEISTCCIRCAALDREVSIVETCPEFKRRNNRINSFSSKPSQEITTAPVEELPTTAPVQEGTKMGTSIDKIKQGAANGIAAVEADALSKAFRSALSASGVEAPEFFDSELGEDVSPLLAALLADFVVGNDTLAGCPRWLV